MIFHLNVFLGSCIGLVIRTGDKTFIGRIANLTAGSLHGNGRRLDADRLFSRRRTRSHASRR